VFSKRSIPVVLLRLFLLSSTGASAGDYTVAYAFGIWSTAPGRAARRWMFLPRNRSHLVGSQPHWISTMTRFRYLFVLIIFLSWLASHLLEDVPRFAEWSLYVSLGSGLAAIIFAVAALVRKKWHAFAAFSLLFAGLIVGECAFFSYRLNNVCRPGDHIIQSDADAIKQAQIKIFRAHYGSHGIPGYVDEKPGYADFSRADCCRVRRSRTMMGIIIWNVELRGETVGEPAKRQVSADMWLSNCGSVFDDSSITAEPAR